MGKNFVMLVAISAAAMIAYQYVTDKYPQVRSFTQKG